MSLIKQQGVGFSNSVETSFQHTEGQFSLSGSFSFSGAGFYGDVSDRLNCLCPENENSGNSNLHTNCEPKGKNGFEDILKMLFAFLEKILGLPKGSLNPSGGSGNSNFSPNSPSGLPSGSPGSSPNSPISDRGGHGSDGGGGGGNSDTGNSCSDSNSSDACGNSEGSSSCGSDSGADGCGDSGGGDSGGGDGGGGDGGGGGDC